MHKNIIICEKWQTFEYYKHINEMYFSIKLQLNIKLSESAIDSQQKQLSYKVMDSLQTHNS